MAKREKLSLRASIPQPPAKLKLFNSLSRKKDEFIPKDENRVTWYSCGPTVYDASHMGHARSYIAFDILRRILSDYFGYDVQYVMNITDIDDKIIKRARQNYLYDTYLAEKRELDVVLEDVKRVMGDFEQKLPKVTDPDKRAMLERTLIRVRNVVDSLRTAVQSNDQKKVNELHLNLLKEAKDLLCDWLDKEKGSTVTEHSIFSKLSQYWEDEFYKDMDALNIMRPSASPRVSEYVPQIVTFTQKIIDRGLAYESNGSIYFDVGKFDKMENHTYAKLVREAYGDTSSLEEGEGDLCTSEERLSEKKSLNDFALWKSSKAGEPSWDSPWGKGRPGWHIECSVMASEICGDSLDIHSGGVDLKFPHHDNELAQSEAYFDSDQWVRYFLHSGHLTISDCKMSKSLKNFITIKEALQKHTARQLRFAFLRHAWKDTLDYNENTMNMATQYEKFLNEFFLTVKCQLRSGDATSKSTEHEAKLKQEYSSAKQKIDAALCDNIDTRTALDHIRDLVTQCNIYLKQSSNPDTQILRDIAEYVTNLMYTFGIKTDSIGFLVETEVGSINIEETVTSYVNAIVEFGEQVKGAAKSMNATSILDLCENLRNVTLSNLGVKFESSDKVVLANKDELEKLQAAESIDNQQIENLVMPYLNAIADFREQVRVLAKSSKANNILETCDKLRDDVLPNLGVRLEDDAASSGKSRVMLVNRAELLKEREAKRAIEAEKALEKKRKKQQVAAALAAKEAQMKIPPDQMFKLETDKYSKFDDQGIPTHDAQGQEVSKGLQKKLVKLQRAQEVKYKEYMSNIANGKA